MISYAPFYKTLLRKEITEYELIAKQGVSSGLLYRMKQGRHVNTKTLDTLCFILHCTIPDIVEYVEDV